VRSSWISGWDFKTDETGPWNNAGFSGLSKTAQSKVVNESHPVFSSGHTEPSVAEKKAAVGGAHPFHNIKVEWNRVRLVPINSDVFPESVKYMENGSVACSVIDLKVMENIFEGSENDQAVCFVATDAMPSHSYTALGQSFQLKAARNTVDRDCV